MITTRGFRMLRTFGFALAPNQSFNADAPLAALRAVPRVAG